MPDRYQKPAKGTEDWDQPLNQNFQALDIDVQVREARAPDAAQESPDQGSMFMDTRSGDIYLADGSSWGTPVWTLDNIGTGSGGGGDISGTDIQPSSIADFETNAPIEGHIIESFDGGLTHYSGDTGVYSIVAGDIAGDNMLEFADTSGATQVIWTPEVETRRGESYAAYMRPAASTSPTLIVCGQLDANSNLHAGYGVYLSPSRGEARLIKEPTTSDSGWFSNTLDTASATINGGTLYRVELDIGFDTIQARVYNESETTVAALSGTDGEFDSGVLGWRDASGTTGNSNVDMVTRQAYRARGGGSGGSGTAGIGDHYATTGDGVTQSFQWSTGVVDAADLNYVTIDASTSAASADYERFIDGTSIGVRYAEPPADGEQLGWYWSVNASVETVDAEADAFDGTGTLIGSYTELQTGDNLTGTVSNGRLTLNASGSGGGGHAVDDNGTEIYADVSRVNFGTDLNVADDGNSNVTVNSTASTSSGGSHSWQVVSGSTGADIQSALDAAAPGGTVFLPQKTYNVSSTIRFDSSHSGVTLTGEGYGSHLQGDGALNYIIRLFDNAAPVENVTVSNLRVSNSDFANIEAHWDTHDDTRGIVFDNIWTHSGDRGILVGSPGTYVDGLRAWDCSHNGLAFHTASGETFLDFPTITRWRWANNVVVWDCLQGIDISRQSGLVSNFLIRNCGSGMKFSAYRGGSGLFNGWIIANEGNGMRTTGSSSTMLQTTQMDNVWSIRNGTNPGGPDGKRGPGHGFDIRNTNFRIGNIYAGGNAASGAQLSSGLHVISQLHTEDNGGGGVHLDEGMDADIMHLSGSGNTDGLVKSTGSGNNLWVLRSRDYAGSQF